MNTYPLKVCTTCLMILVNDEGDPDWTEEQEDEHRFRMAARLEGLHVVPGDSEDDEEFSRSWCDACGSTLAGTRHAATCWPVEEEA